MATSRIERISRHQFRLGEPLLFDTNIWLYLFRAPSSSGSRLTNVYSRAYKQALQAKARILLDPLVLSEYLNTYCRIEARAAGFQASHYKQDFRRSDLFTQKVGPTSAALARNILATAEVPQTSLDGSQIKLALSGFETGDLDINDALLAETCRRNGWTLVTNDGDFRSAGIDVLTENEGLLVP